MVSLTDNNDLGNNPFLHPACPATATAVTRRNLLAALVLPVVIAIVPPAAASSQAADALDSVRRRGELKIGMEGTYPPFNFQDEHGILTGFEVEIADAMCQVLGVKPVIIPTRWDGMLAALDSRRLDVVMNQVVVTPERMTKYDFSKPYTVSGIQIFIRSDTKGPSTPAALAGKSVGIVLGSNYQQWLEANAPQADIRTYDDDVTRNQDLLVGRLDAVLNDRLIAANLAKQYGGRIVPAGAPFATQSVAVALRKGNPALLVAINAGLDKLRSDGTLAGISRKYFSIDVTS